MMEHFIKEAIEEKGQIGIPGLGTLVVDEQPGGLDEDLGLVLPPSRKISFLEDVSSSELSIVQYLSDKTYRSTSDLEADVAEFIDELKRSLNTEGRKEIGDLGYFTKTEDERIDFVTFEDATVLPDSYGLPKLKIQSLAPAVAGKADQAPVPEGKEETALWLALIPLVLIAVVVAYLFINKDAQRKLWTVFDHKSQNPPAQASVADVPSDSIKTASSDSVPTATPPAEAPVAQEEAQPTTAPETTKPAAVTPPPTTSASGNANTPMSERLVVDKTNRWYLSIASFNSLPLAQEGAEKAIKKGFPNVKIIQAAADKFRVSIDDFDNRANADTRVKEVADSYSNIWVFKY